MSFQTQKSFIIFQNTIYDILNKTREACDCPIDCQTTNTVKAQKRIKNLIRIVHLSSVVQPTRYETTRILFIPQTFELFVPIYLKKNKKSKRSVE